MSIEYHLKELEIALDRNDSRRILPSIDGSDRAILDIGCGIGQTFIALGCTGRACVGLDVDDEAIRYGMENYGANISYILADAGRMPLPSRVFDLVFSRVSIPYTNVPKVIREIGRVLREDGRVWMTLHGREKVIGYLGEAIRARSIKRSIHVTYILFNGYLLKYFGFVLPFVDGRYESWQDPSAMRRLLLRNGFDVTVGAMGGHTIVEGRLVGGVPKARPRVFPPWASREQSASCSSPPVGGGR
jgi:SAM-dependent methyltransferase